MASCAKCGAALTATAKFCGTCGSRITASSLPPPPRAPAPAPVGADPFAKTVFGDSGDTAQAAAQPPSPPPPQAQPQPPAQGAYARGALVLVHWADGNRYPATVLHATGSHVFVVFPTGQQQWVDVRYVSTG
jgi:hypothetical protein